MKHVKAIWAMLKSMSTGLFETFTHLCLHIFQPEHHELCAWVQEGAQLGGCQGCVCMPAWQGVQFPLVPMGALAPGSAHARPSAQLHIDTSESVWGVF